MFDVAIIGCGISGASMAYELSHYNLNIVVLEKENDVANATTKANSAILHAGYDPKPGTLMARLNVRGVQMAKEICENLNIERKEIGSLVLAFSDEDLYTIKTLYENGIKNQVPDLKLLNDKEVQQLEPNLSKDVKGALLAPSAAIVDPIDYALAMIETAVKNGVELKCNCPVQKIAKQNGSFTIEAGGQTIQAQYIVNAAGVDCDFISSLVGDESFKILPSRGEYYILDKNQSSLVNHVIFQCPNKNGKGVLVSPTVHGNLLVGPDAQSVSHANDVNNTANGLAFVKEKAVLSVPSIDFRLNIRNYAGVRANSDQPDFIIGESRTMPGFFHLSGIKSPGLTSAPASAEYLIQTMKNCGLKLVAKENFDNTRNKVRFKNLSTEDQNRLIQSNPRYGRIICRCETITEGEIYDALNSPVPPQSIDGVKRRCNAGMGRCQGGFCSTRIHAILADFYHVSPSQIMMDEEGTWIIENETKGGPNND